MERLDRIDKPNRKPNFTLSDDVDLDKLFRDGGEWRLEEGVDYTGSRSAVAKYIRDEFRARFGDCVIAYKQGTDESVVVRITPPSLASPAERAEVLRRVMAQESA